MEELTQHLEYTKLLAYISLGIMVIIYIVQRFFRKYKWAKYLPGLILILFGFYSLLTIEKDSFQSEGIGNLVSFLVSTGSGVIGLFFALILGVYNKEKKTKKGKDKTEEK